MSAMAPEKKKRRKAKPKATPPVNLWLDYLVTLRARVGQREGKDRPLTQTEAGRRIGISQNLWSAWERGARKPDASRRLLLKLLESGKLPKIEK